MVNLAGLWNTPTDDQERPQPGRSTKGYTDIQKEYQTYIKHNQTMNERRRKYNAGMIELVKGTKTGDPRELLKDSLELIGLMMNDPVFYNQTMNNLKENEHMK